MPDIKNRLSEDQQSVFSRILTPEPVQSYRSRVTGSEYQNEQEKREKLIERMKNSKK